MPNLRLSPQEAAQELLSRRKSRQSLKAFTEYTNSDYKTASHQLRIIEHLEAIERGDIDRLMIFTPPRHGKSELGSKRFPAWYIGRNPSKQIIAASYNANIAFDYGREVRNIVNSSVYQNVFKTLLAQDSKAANRWHTNMGGSYVSAGVGTAITGRGAHIAVIDDPFKDYEEADSGVIREKVWEWYTSTFYTRLMPGGAIILIQTRWHDDDLAGRLLNGDHQDNWTVLELPALVNGEALWSEWYPEPALQRIRTAIGGRNWSALYQQKPIPDEGTYFKREWFQWYEVEQLPKYLRIYGASDYAVTEDDGDFTEHGVFGVDLVEDIYIIDWWNGQTTADKWIDAKCDLIDEYRPLFWGGEAGVIRKSVEPFMLKRMRERKSYCAIEWVASIRDKPTRARSFQARASMGKVYLPNNEIGQRLLDQLLRFPNSARDDAVDACALFGQLLDRTIPGKVGELVSKKTDIWGRRINGAKSWKVM